MTLVVDASVVVAALVDAGPTGSWAEAMLLEEPRLVAPHLIHPEVTNVLRRTVARGAVSDLEAGMAQHDLLRLPLELWPYEPVAERVWDLRHNLSTYDGWYVALAELLEAPLATADLRLARAPGLRCEVRVPSSD